MTNYLNASRTPPELDAEPRGNAKKLFDYFSSLPREDKPQFVGFHRGRVLASFSYPGHASRWESIRNKVRDSGWGVEVHEASSRFSSHVIWEPI